MAADAEGSGTAPVPPPRARGRQAAPPRPELPADAEPDLPKAAYRELRDHAPRGAQRDLAVAVTLARDALEAGDPGTALPYLTWAKHRAPRSATVRETLAIARYLTEDYGAAVTELQTYRRLAGREDQNHLLADSLRALDRDTARIAEAAAAVDPQRDGWERYVEAMIVWASTLADRGDPSGAQAVLARALDHQPSGGEVTEVELRLWYVAGDVAQRAGDVAGAAEHFTAVHARDPEFHDVAERLASLP